MSIELPTWPRKQFQPGGGQAFVFFAIYGEFSSEVQISRPRYRTMGVPAGFEVRRLDRETTPEFPFSTGPIGKVLEPKEPALFKAINETAECTVIQGIMADPPDLNYLRDVVGLVQFFLDHGGIAVMDPQQLKLYDPARWRSEVFEPEPPQVNRHVVILISEEAGNGRLWFHTRGLRKFGRPDLSVRNAPRDRQLAVIELCNRFIALQADGALIPEGQEIRMDSLPPGLVCHHAGAVDDPDFNNVHVDIRWPE